MNILKTLVLSTCLSLTVNAFGMEVTAGHLSEKVGGNTMITTLTVTGTINAADIDFINNKLFNLTTLDLSGVTVVAYDGTRVLSGGTQYPAGMLPEYSFMGMTKLANVTLPAGLTVIGESVFASTGIISVGGSSSSASLKIPASVTSIGNYAFASCAALTSAEIPSTVTTLGEGLFKECTALTTAKIYSPETTIGALTFSGCSKLTTVQLQNTVRTIGQEAFLGCSVLSSFAMPTSLTSIGASAFYGSGLSSASLADCTSFASMGDYAFAMCKNLTTVNLGDRVFVMGVGTFYNDDNLRNITLPTGTTVIPALTFKGNSVIDANAAVPETVTEIGDYALAGWTNADKFVFPKSLERIGDGAMESWDASRITELSAENLAAVPQTGNDVWRNVNQSAITLYVHDSIHREEFANAPQWKEFTIKVRSTGDDLVELVPTTSDVKFHFEGTTLVITCKDHNIVNTNIYDLDGRMRYSTAGRANRVDIDTSGWSRMLIIAEVTLDTGQKASMKITRN